MHETTFRQELRRYAAFRSNWLAAVALESAAASGMADYAEKGIGLSNIRQDLTDARLLLDRQENMLVREAGSLRRETEPEKEARERDERSKAVIGLYALIEGADGPERDGLLLASEEAIGGLIEAFEEDEARLKARLKAVLQAFGRLEDIQDDLKSAKRRAGQPV